MKETDIRAASEGILSISLTLPERQEDHRLHRTELQDRLEGRQQVARGEIKQEQPVQGERHRNIINNCDVNVTPVRTPIAVVIMSERLQEYNYEGHQWFHEAELQSGLLAETEETYRVSLAVEATGAVQAARADRFASYLGHYVAFAAQVLVAEGEEVVYHEGCKMKVVFII